MKMFTVTYDGKVCGVNNKGEMYCLAGVAYPWSYDPSEKLQHLAVSGNGRHFWGSSGGEAGTEAYYRSLSAKEWVKLPFQYVQVCASYNGSTVWGKDPAGGIWTYSSP